MNRARARRLVEAHETALAELHAYRAVNTSVTTGTYIALRTAVSDIQVQLIDAIAGPLKARR